MIERLCGHRGIAAFFVIALSGEPADAQTSTDGPPLPAGTIACDFGAFNNDSDPAGLNVRAAPDRNSAILGPFATAADARPRHVVFGG